MFPRALLRRLATRIFLTFAVALGAFGAVAAFGALRLHDLGRELRLLSGGYLPLTRVAAQLEVKDWATPRALEARALDPRARRVWLPVVRAQFPALVKEKIEEGRRFVREARPLAGGDDARFLDEVDGRLKGLGSRWAEYDRAAGALFDALEGGTAATDVDARIQSVRTLEKGLSLDAKLLRAALESRVGDRFVAAERAEARTVALIALWSLVALAIGVGAALVSQRLLAPIQRLTEGVKAVAAGDLTREVEVRGSDELGVLAREFNAMAASLDRQQRDLRNAERLAAVGRISAQITHEIRNPLNAIGLNAELLSEELARLAPPPREAAVLVAAISREVDRLEGVAEEYLKFARLPRATPTTLDLDELVASLLEFLGPELAAAKVAVSRDLAPSLPPVMGDEAQLRAVVHNLVRNSREAMPEGGTLTVRTRQADGGIELRVADTGGGMPPEVLAHVFEPFYTTKERGTGLGLAYASRVVAEHGGTIQCDSSPGRGTEFTLRLPAAPLAPRP
ncbi:MAG: ATP-binding protein [Anaeromyxobacteraceae bacterium]